MTAVSAKSETALAHMESLTHEGLAVAHVDGKAVFIHGSLPGETVRFRYRNRRRRYDTGVVTEILTPSADRVAPECPHFGQCGGCSLQHLRSSAQVAAKQAILFETLARIGGVVPEHVLSPVTGPEWHYRRRARLGARLVPKKGGVIVGFRERGSSFIAPLEGCRILDARVSDLIPAIRDVISRLSCPDRIPQVEVAAGDQSVVLVFRHVTPLTEADHHALAAFGTANGITVYLQPGGPESVHPLPSEAAVSLEYQVEEGVRLHFAPTDFVQINAAVNAAMVARAIELLGVTHEDRIVDFFCGLGNFSLPLARRAQHVTGVEGSAPLVSRARENALTNQVGNVEFVCEDLYRPAAEVSAGTEWWNQGFDKALLDPPRSGAMELLKRINADSIRRILYVSCYPGTLARDAEFLVNARGYRAVSAGILDLFPHTSHVESCVLFERD
ncbi:MAG: 23S rRNA (uracil(1939)-C(5))-methyltransferase RlmD [Acidiferrobacteraceae bacterium]